VKTASIAIPFEDAELVEQCRGGDSAAFGRLVVKYQDRVFNTCWRLCGNRADAEDLTQEAFVRALQSIDGFGGRSKFYTWVFRIAVNLAISVRRKKKRAACYSLDQGREGIHGPAGSGNGTSASPANRLATPGGTPQEQASDREREAIVMEALAGLEEEHRAVVILRDLESFGYEEIAEILGVPTGTVKSRLHRARLALREKLAPILGAG